MRYSTASSSQRLIQCAIVACYRVATNGFHVIVTGDTGTGKVYQSNHAFVNGQDPGYMSININFSAQTIANATQDMIDLKLDKRRKGVNGPPIGTKCIVFVDDLIARKKFMVLNLQSKSLAVDGSFWVV